MTGVRDTTQLCFSSNFTRMVANKIEQRFYSVYSYSGIESIERALNYEHGFWSTKVDMVCFSTTVTSKFTETTDTSISLVHHKSYEAYYM